MRYTTVIDISEIPAVYKSESVRLVYLHLVLKAGYHDDDRDRVTVSLRRLAAAVGVTVGATRHALEVLQRAGLVTRSQDQAWIVKKWLVQDVPTPRTQARKSSAEDNSLVERREREIEEWRQKVYEAVRSMSRAELEEWLAELKEGRSRRHRGAVLSANQAHIEWLQSIIAKL